MACRGFWECLLKLFNFVLSVTGLAMVGYGIYLVVQFSKASDDDTPAISPASDDSALIQLGRPMLMAVSLSDNIFDKLPKAWYGYRSFPFIKLCESLITLWLVKGFVFCYIFLHLFVICCLVWI